MVSTFLKRQLKNNPTVILVKHRHCKTQNKGNKICVKNLPLKFFVNKVNNSILLNVYGIKVNNRINTNAIMVKNKHF